MNFEITKKDLNAWRKEYHKNPQNKMIEDTITRVGIDDGSIRRESLIENQALFNLELETGAPTNQKSSGRCWIFAGCNMIRSHIAQQMNIDLKNLMLSHNYLSFYAKLERLNRNYENIIETGEMDYDLLYHEDYFEWGEGGNYEPFSYLVEKYGLVPELYMPETHDSVASQRLNTILQEKMLCDVDEILTLKKNHASIDEIRKAKESMLQEGFQILSKVLGEPVEEFTLEYMDKDKNVVCIEHMTPQKFKKAYLKLNLQDFVTLSSNHADNRIFYQKYRYNRVLGSMNRPYEYLNVPMQIFTECTVNQLKDGIPVYFICPTTKMWNRKDWIIDTRNYNYAQTLGLKERKRNILDNLHEIPGNHAMLIVGTHLVLNQPIRWKVENSWGNEKNGNQFIVMNQNFFESYLVSVIIHKKYLPKKILELIDQDPILINVYEH